MLFAASLVGFGIQGLVTGSLTALWQPVPKFIPGVQLVAYLCAAVSLVCGACLPRFAGALFVYLALWVLLCRAPFIIQAPLTMDPWENCAETAVILAAAAILSGRVQLGRPIYGVAMMVFGIAHFAYLKETASLVPSWLPAHGAWAAFTGGAYIAAGAAMLIGRLARLAAILSAVQMGGFTLLVWLPIIAAAGPKTPFQWSETLISAMLTIAGWVVAESYFLPEVTHET